MLQAGLIPLILHPAIGVWLRSVPFLVFLPLRNGDLAENGQIFCMRNLICRGTGQCRIITYYHRKRTQCFPKSWATPTAETTDKEKNPEERKTLHGKSKQEWGYTVLKDFCACTLSLHACSFSWGVLEERIVERMNSPAGRKAGGAETGALEVQESLRNASVGSAPPAAGHGQSRGGCSAPLWGLPSTAKTGCSLIGRK